MTELRHLHFLQRTDGLTFRNSKYATTQQYQIKELGGVTGDIHPQEVFDIPVLYK